MDSCGKRFLCATSVFSVFSVSLWLLFRSENLTTETQRTQRLHREEAALLILVDLLDAGVANGVSIATTLTRRNCSGIRPQRLAAGTHPTAMPRGIAIDQLVGTNIMSDNCAGPNQATLAQPDTANYGGIRSHSGSLFNPGLDWNPVRVAASWDQVVGQHCVWSKKNVVADVDVLPHADTIFDRYIVADCYPALDESVVADVAVGADHSSLQYMSERPNSSTFADVVCFYQRLLVDECRLSGVAHNSQFTRRLFLWHPDTQAVEKR